jgi:hypothetical protein
VAPPRAPSCARDRAEGPASPVEGSRPFGASLVDPILSDIG